MSTLILSSHLKRLIRRCETLCEAACCGLDAFDFHPIHFASAALAMSSQQPQEVLEKIEEELRELEIQAGNASSDDNESFEWCETLNVSFSPVELRLWIAQMRVCLSGARTLLSQYP
jgi:hypothetical protein